jgi:23S rRNA pseudouridine955/2504/2580 synthase
MREITVNKNDADQRVDKFLSKTLPKLPKNLMYKYIRNKKIKVNGKRCQIDQRLEENDILRLYIAEEFFDVKKDTTFLQVSSDIDVVYEDENIIVMNKPVGLLTHGDIHEGSDTLVNRMKKYLYEKNEYRYENEQSFTPSLAHRIDRNTQGLVIGAKNAESLREVNRFIREGYIDKFYLALVEGILPKKHDVWIHYHKKENQKIKISKNMKEGSKEVKLEYKVLDVRNKISLVEVELHSGKSHQIRAQFASEGYPLLGDFRYGAGKKDFIYQALCAYRLCFHIQDESSLAYLNDKEIKLTSIILLDYFKTL